MSGDPRDETDRTAETVDDEREPAGDPAPDESGRDAPAGATNPAADGPDPGPGEDRDRPASTGEGSPGAIELTESDVAVTKRVVPGDGDDGARIAFRLTTSAEGARSVRVVEPLPEDVDPDSVRIDPEFADGWDRGREGLAFRTVMGPGDEVTTGYRPPPGRDPAGFLGRPRVDVSDLSAGGSGSVLDRLGEFLTGGSSTDDPGDEAAAVASDVDPDVPSPSEGGRVERGDDADTERARDPEPGAERGDEPVDGRITPDSGAGDGASDDDRTGDAATDSRAGQSTDVPEALVDAETVAGALETELRAGRVDGSTLTTLRGVVDRESDESSAGSAAIEARVARLEQRTGELSAYADELASFLEDPGTAAAIRERLDEVSTTVESLDERASATGERVGDLAGRVEGVSSRVERLEERLGRVDDRVETVAERLEGTREAGERARSRLDDLEDRVGTLAEDVDADAAARETAVAELRDDLAALRADVDALVGFRDRVGRVVDVPDPDREHRTRDGTATTDDGGSAGHDPADDDGTAG